ncbi:MAG: hypothetical protein JW745_09260, partial [Sedimentisphaerales bacterium]|nr:hypothetical protein [Sedimentisphaerales bacterium]
SLAIDLGGDIDLSDDDATDGSSWAYFDVGGITAAYNNTAGSDGDGAIEITLPDGSDASSYGAVGYYFETPAGAGIDYSYLSIDFSYNIELAANVGLGDFGQMAVMLVRDDGDGILEGTDTAVFSSDIGSFRQYSDGVTGGNSGWVDVTNYNIGVVDDNNAYFVLFIGLVSDSAAGADSYVRLDDLSVNYTGYSEWSSAETNDTDNGSNNTVGWNNNGVWNYNFRGDMHSALIDNGTIDIHSQLLTIPDYNQAYSGDAIVAFRYRHDGLDYLQANLPDLTDIRVLVDGVEYDKDQITAQLGGEDLYFDYNASWSTGTREDLKYTWFKITIPDLPAGDHDISFELMGGDSFWIDNVVVQSTRSRTDTIDPIVKLGAVGQDGVRPFVVGATYASDELLIYPGSGSELGDKHLINNHLAGSGVYPFGADAFYHAALFELNDNIWEKYGNSHVALGNLTLVGVPGSDTSVPIAELYSLDDFAIGDNQLIWVALSHATTDPVDTDDPDSDINFYAVHPFDMSNPPSYYGPHTDLDIVIRRWDIVDANDTDNQEWLDVPAPITLDTWAVDHELRATFKGQLTSSPDQSIIFAWTNLDPDGARFSSHAYKNINGSWEAIGSDTVNGNIQNNRNWSATLMHEMIVDSSGNPLVLYGMTHLDMYALREFVLERDDSDAVISIPGSNSLFLDFGQISRGVVSRQMTVANTGLGDLIVQNISFGGLEAIEAGFTITNDPGIGTSQSIIPAGANSRYSYNIQFDRSKIDPNLYGTFEGVIVVQTNEGRSENHPFDNFQEVNVRVVIENAGDVIIDSDYYYYNDKIVAGTFDPSDHDDDNNITVDNPYEWQTQTIYVRNDGTDTLNVNSLLHTGAGFAIKSIKKNGSDLAINNMDADDDGLLDAGTSLEAGEYLAVEVAFIPKEAGLYNETIFVCTDDTFEPVIPIRLLGYGLNGGDLEVQTSLDGITWTTVWRTNADDGSDDIDRILDLGSTLWGTSDATPLMVRVNNTGSTTMNVENIRFQSGTAQVAFSPDAVISDVDIAPGSSYTFTMTYTPDTGLVEDINAEDSIRYLMESLFILTDALDDSEVVLSVVGYAVPKAPVLQVIDADTGDIVGGWDPERGFVTDGLMNLGTGNVGSSVFTRTVFLRNLGGAPLTVNGLSVGYVGANASDYVITPANSLNSNLDNTILTMDGLNYTVNITMTPTVKGELKSMFMVDYLWTDIYGDANYDLSYTGLFAKVTDQAIVLSDNDGIVNNTILDFQKVGVGGTGYGSVIITNQGSSKLNILGWDLYNNGVLVVDSDLNDDWVTNANSPFSMLAYESSFKINGNASHTIPLTFDPLAADTVYPAMIRIYSDDATQTDNGDGRYYTDYIISGEGVTPGVLATDVTEVDFGAVEFGQHWSDGNGGFRQIVTITNTSTVNISLVNIYSTSDVFNVWTDMDMDDGQSFVSGSIFNGDYILAPDESIDVAISFYAAQPFFDTSSGVLPKLVFEYDNYSGSETLQSQEVSLHASVVMADSPSSRSNKLIWSDTNGKLVTISLAGPGSFSVLAVSSDNKDIGAIVLNGTTSRSTLKIVGENNKALPISTIGSIVGADGQAISEIGNIIMQNVNFDGTAYDTAGYDHDIYVQSLTGKLILGDIVDAADIYVASTSTGGAAITTGSIATGTDIYIGGNVRSFTVDSKTNNAGGVQGDSLFVGGDLRSFTVKDYGPIAMDIEVAGDLRTLNAGRSNFYNGDLFVDGSLGNANLSAATITGSVISDNLNKMTAFALDGATIAVQDTIRLISVRDDMIDSLILAGVTPGADKVIGNTLTKDDGLVGGSVIGKVIVGGTATDSSVLAGVGANSDGNYQVFGSSADQQPLSSVSGTIGYVKFGDVKLGLGNTLEYGIAAGTSVGKFIYKSNTYRAPEAWNLDSIIGNDFFLKTF